MEKEIECIVKDNLLFDQTINLVKLLGAPVLSKNDIVVGSVSKIGINPKDMKMEGIVVRRGIFKKPVYIGRNYLWKLSNDSIFLNIDPSILLRGKRVVDIDGSVIGKVKRIEREGNTNEIDKLIVGKLFRQEFYVPVSDIKSVGNSIMLKTNYNAAKKYIGQRS